MIVVSDTSPLTNLAAIGHFDLLRKLFGQIHIAPGVWDELNHGGLRHPGSSEVENASWVRRHAVGNGNLVVVLQRDLDRGESETLALAVELNAEIVLLDEQEGRRTATRLGLRPLGVLGILLEAKRRGEIEEIRSLLDALRNQAGFFLSEGLYQQTLDQAGERAGG
jgi:predicted nucleic acid-binding protein